MTIFVVILTDHGAVDYDTIRLFGDRQAAIDNFLAVADDIQLCESDSYEIDMDSLSAWSEHYSVNVFEKVIG